MGDKNREKLTAEMNKQGAHEDNLETTRNSQPSSKQTTDQREMELAELLKATEQILEKNDFEVVSRQIFDACARTIGATAGYVALLSEDGAENELLFLEDGGMKCTVDPDLPMPIRGLRNEAYQTGKVVYDNDFMKSEWIKFMPDGHMALPNVLFAPLNVERKTVGIMGFACKKGDFTENDAKLAAAFGHYAAIALQNSQIFDALEKSEQAYSKLFHTIGEGIGIVNDKEVFTFCNEAAEDIFEVERGSLPGRSLEDFLQEADMEKIAAETKKRKSGEDSRYELKIKSDKGNTKYLLVTASPSYDSEGRFESTFGVFFDITARKVAQEKVQKLLEEKEMLLREVHHRIKNNMSSIASLLNMKSRIIGDAKVEAALKDAVSRLQGMSVLYDKLYRSDDFRKTSLNDYLPDLVDEIVNVFHESKDVKVKKKIEKINIDPDLNFPLCIIINELLTNAMKYAFKKSDRKNELSISARLKDSNVEIILQDNGVGLPADFNMDETEGLGVNLVGMLAKQMDGNISYESDNSGTKWTFEFPANTKNTKRVL